MIEEGGNGWVKPALGLAEALLVLLLEALALRGEAGLQHCREGVRRAPETVGLYTIKGCVLHGLNISDGKAQSLGWGAGFLWLHLSP